MELNINTTQKGNDASPKASTTVTKVTKDDEVAMDTTPALEVNEVTAKANPSVTGTKPPKRPTPKKAARRNAKPQDIDEKTLSAELKELNQLEEQKRLSGAGRRRYAYHRNNGKSIKEAYNLACRPMQETLTSAQAEKRVRGPSTTPPTNKKTKISTTPREVPIERRTHSAQHRPAAEAQPSTSGTSYRDAIKGIRIGVIHADHPHHILTAEQLAACQKFILSAIPSAAKVGINPQFRGLSLKPGWMLVTCLDEKTAKWLEQTTAKLNTDESNYIRAVREENIPKLEIITGYFPSEEESTEEILILIDSQNPKVSAVNWKTLSRRKEGTCTVITFSIDSQSMESLKQIGFRVSYKFGAITLRPKNKEVNSGQPQVTSDVPKKKE